ncbi:MAG: PKD domain-containing protein [Candidatus Zixiibacteriota bacterium]
MGKADISGFWSCCVSALAVVAATTLAVAPDLSAQTPQWCPAAPVPLCADGPGQLCVTLPIPDGISVSVDGATWNNGSFCFQAPAAGTYQFQVIANLGTQVDSCSVTVEVSFGAAPQIVCPGEPFQLSLCAPGKVCLVVPTKNAASVIASGAEVNDSGLCIQVDSSGVYYATVIAVNACGADTCVVSAVVTIEAKPAVGCTDTIFTIEQCEFAEVCVPVPVRDANQVTTSLGSWRNDTLCFFPDTAGYYLISVRGTNYCGSSECTVAVQIIKREKPAIIVPFTPPSIAICGPGPVCVPCLIVGADQVLVGGGEWASDTLCFSADTSGLYTFNISATNDCGTNTVDGFGVHVTVDAIPGLLCPTDTLQFAGCDTVVCIDVPLVVTNADTLIVTGGTYAEGQLCFTAGESGVYAFAVTAKNRCGQKTCEFFVSVTREMPPFVHCPLIELNASVCYPGDTACVELPIDRADIIGVSGVVGGHWVNGRLCFVTDSQTAYSASVMATNTCGSVECDVFVNVEFAQRPQIVCPPEPISVSVCGAAEVCIDLPITGATAVFLDGATWQEGRLCFSPVEPGSYSFEVVAFGTCENDTCMLTINVESGSVPIIDCWQEDPEQFTPCGAGEVCRWIGGRITGATDVEVVGGSYVEGNLCFFADTVGLYRHTVIAANDCGADTCAFYSQVWFVPSPEACFTTSSGTRPLEVQFTNCTPDLLSAGYTWDFGDGTTEVGTFHPVHQYQYSGCYLVTMVAGNWCGSDTVADSVCVSLAGIVTPTDQWISIYCQNPTFNGAPLQPGDEIGAHDPSGRLCGLAVVEPDGSFGFAPVYRDDGYTTEDEGAIPGDTLRFSINGVFVLVNPPVVWTEMGDRIPVCEFTDLHQVCRTLHLKTGWNLISFNVAYSEPIKTALQNIWLYVDVVLGFDRKGLTYDPFLEQYSTLDRLDHRHGYWFKMRDNVDLDLCGYDINPDDAIAIYRGWNLVSYWPYGILSVEDGFASILDNLELAYTFEDAILIWRATQPQFNTLTELKPNLGYWVKSSADDVLAYPGFGGGGPIVDSNGGVSDVPPSRSWMSIYGSRVMLDGVELANGTLIEAYTQSGTRCGAGVYENGVLKFLPIYGYDDADASLQLYPQEGDPVSLHVGGVRVYPDIVMQPSGGRLRTEALSLTPTGVDDEEMLPRQFALAQNYPNPFNPTTTISFELPMAKRVRIDIYNVMGQRVTTLVDAHYEAGQHSVEFDATGVDGHPLAGGMYIYRLEAGTFVETRKMILLK